MPPPPTGPACPSCGAPLPARNPGVVAGVCAYCDTVVTWDADAARDSGTKSRLPRGFTRLYTGATGTVLDRPFRVLGRARYTTGGAFWDEWAVEVDDGGQPVLRWITEDDHELAYEEARRRIPPGAVAGVKPGASVEVLGRLFRIEEVGEARCVGLEGQLPKELEPDETYRYADGSTPNGAATLGIEYDDTEPMVFVGRWLAPEDLRLDDEGVEW